MNVSQETVQSLHEEAVAHAVLAKRSGGLMWNHIESEYTQDLDKIAATLDTRAPLAWTLAREALTRQARSGSSRAPRSRPSAISTRSCARRSKSNAGARCSSSGRAGTP